MIADEMALQELRKTRSITQAALAKKLGVAQKQVSELENRAAGPTPTPPVPDSSSRSPMRTSPDPGGCDNGMDQDQRKRSGGGGFCLQFLCGVMGDEGVDGGLKHALHDHCELVVG